MRCTRIRTFAPLPLDQEGVRYEYGPDSSRRPGVPHGFTVELRWHSTADPRTVRTVWIHVPAAYDPAEPAGLVLFQDGWWYLDPDGEVRGGIVLDNLVHRGDIPVTIGVFVDPGIFEDVDDPVRRKNRNAGDAGGVVVVERDHVVGDHVLRRLERLHPRRDRTHPAVGRDANHGLTEAVTEVDLDLIREAAAEELPVVRIGSRGIAQLDCADVGTVQQLPQAGLGVGCFM